MPLPGRIINGPDGTLGFDTNTPVSLAAAAGFHNDGFRFCLRYLSLGAGQQPGDLTTAEANHILDGGLALMPVQHVRNAGWRAAEGEIIAYLDDDAAPDQHWLVYLASAFMASDDAGIGGPNISSQSPDQN